MLIYPFLFTVNISNKMIKTEAILDRLKKKRLKIQIFKHLFALAFYRGQGRLPKLRYC